MGFHLLTDIHRSFAQVKVVKHSFHFADRLVIILGVKERYV